MTARLYPYDSVSDPLDLSAGKIAAASGALTLIATRMESIGLLIVSARKPGSDRLGIDQNLSLLQSEITIAANDANFDGGTWFLPAKSQAGAGAVGPMGLEGLYSLSNPSAAEINILSFSTFGASDSDLRHMTQSLADALSGLSTAQTFLGYLSSTLDDRSGHNFVFAAGVGSLVNADMNEDSTRIVALETQQQLGIQSLSIANDNASIVLKLLG
jgi:flagellin